MKQFLDPEEAALTSVEGHRESLDAEFGRIRKSLGLDTRSSLKNEVDQFLGRLPARRGNRNKIPRYEPFFPWDAISAYRHLSEGLSSPDHELEKRLIQTFQNAPKGSLEWSHAFNDLVKAFVRLVIHRTRQFHKSGVPQEDLVQECLFGLLRAAEKADISLGNRFSTYAGAWIDQTATRYIGNHSRLVRIPMHAHEAIKRAKAIRRDDYLHGRPPRGMQKIEAELKLAPGNLSKLLAADKITISLQDWSKTNDLVDDFNLEAHVENYELERDITVALDLLHPREAGVLRSRFGINTGEELSLDEIGQKFGVTRERIRQLEKKGLKNLLEGPLAEKLRAHVGLQPLNDMKVLPAVNQKVVRPSPSTLKSTPRINGSSNRARTLTAANETIEKVQRALDLLGEDAPPGLREAGELRIKYPQASLSELAILANPQMTKDAMAGRLRRLMEKVRNEDDLIQVKSPVAQRPRTQAQQVRERTPDQLTADLWNDVVRKTELANVIAGGRISQSEKIASDWVLARKFSPVKFILRDAGGIKGVLSILDNLRFLIGNPWK